MKELELAQKYCIFQCVAGSRSYGTDSAHSDLDTRGVFIAPPEYTLGCMKTVEQVEVPGEDTVIYELAKFVKLAAETNPNLIELLFTNEENILFIDPTFEKLREHRDLFLSKKAGFTFSGYAMAQMKRIRGHNKWLNSPQPERAPHLLDFATFITPRGVLVKGIALTSNIAYGDACLIKVNATTFRIFQSPHFKKPILSEDGQNIQFVDISKDKLSVRLEGAEFLGTLIVQKEAYRTQHRMWKDYWQWKKNRNKTRAELEEKYGFDCKHASHLIRLLRMSHEILRDGKVIVRRPDADELIAIRNGSFNYDQLVETAKRMDAELDELYEKSTLPHSADKDAINKLYMSIVTEYWARNKISVPTF